MGISNRKGIAAFDFGIATVSVGAEISEVISYAVFLKTPAGAAPPGRQLVKWWLSDTDRGVPTSTLPNGSVAFAGSTIIDTVSSKVNYLIETSATVAGRFTGSIGHVGAGSWWVCWSVGGFTQSVQVTFT